MEPNQKRRSHSPTRSSPSEDLKEFQQNYSTLFLEIKNLEQQQPEQEPAVDWSLAVHQKLGVLERGHLFSNMGIYAADASGSLAFHPFFHRSVDPAAAGTVTDVEYLTGLLTGPLSAEEFFATASDTVKSAVVGLQEILMDIPLVTAYAATAVVANPYGFMMDKYASPVFKTLLEVCTDRDVQDIAVAVSRDIDLLLQLVENQTGFNSIPKLITVSKQSADPYGLGKIMEALANQLLSLISSANGRSLISYCLANNRIKNHTNLFYQKVYNYWQKLTKQQEGCLVLCDFINDPYNPCQRTLVYRIVADSLSLARHRFGNYVVSHLLGLECPPITQSICQKLRNNYTELSMHKNGSHVVEKILESSYSHYPLQEILCCSSDELEQLATHEFGNYVIQSALKVAKGNALAVLVNSLREHLDELRYHPCGSKVVARVERIILLKKAWMLN